jgi:hypothetical protein
VHEKGITKELQYYSERGVVERGDVGKVHHTVLYKLNFTIKIEVFV